MTIHISKPDCSPFLYRMTLRLLTIIITIYYREYQVLGSSNIPHDGGIIFVAAPHANQMFDPVLVMRAILEKAHRIVSNLLPSVWMRTKLVGSVARCLNATTMERPVDFQKPGSGKIYMSDTAGSPLLVRGIDTDFEREARAGDYLILPKHGGVSAMATVQEIRSSNEIVLKRPFRPWQSAVDQLCPPPGNSHRSRHGPSSGYTGSSYSLASKMDRTQLYGKISSDLARGGSLLMLPEGASHDTPGLMPLHVGVAVIALEEKMMNPNSNTTIVPCGIYHSEAHIFRSRVLVEFGPPINVSKMLAERYRAGHREDAIRQLLNGINESLRDIITAAAADEETLSVVEAMCKLYYPLGKPKDTFAEAYLLRRRMLESYLEQKDRNETIDLASDVIEYQRQLRGLGILDDHVALPNLSFGPNCWMLVRQSLLLVIALTLVLPGLLLFGPLSLVAEHYAWKRARFLTSVSPWRKTGLDTVSTGRVLNILKTMPILFTLYAIVVSFYMGSSQHQALSLVVSLIFVVVISSFITAVTVFATDLASDILQSRGPPIFSSSPPNKTVLANLRSCREELSYKVHKFFTISESQPGNASRDTARYHKAER